MSFLFKVVCGLKPIPRVAKSYVVSGSISPASAITTLIKVSGSTPPQYTESGLPINPIVPGIYPRLYCHIDRLFYDLFELTSGGEETTAGTWIAEAGIKRAEDPAANWQPVGSSGATGIPIFTPDYGDGPSPKPGFRLLRLIGGEIARLANGKLPQIPE